MHQRYVLLLYAYHAKKFSFIAGRRPCRAEFSHVTGPKYTVRLFCFFNPPLHTAHTHEYPTRTSTYTWEEERVKRGKEEEEENQS